MLSGVYTAKKKNGAYYFRSNITYRGKHISLGSFQSEKAAHAAYVCAGKILNSPELELEMVFDSRFNALPFDKRIVLFNFRINNIYIKNPIYLRKNFFSYFLSPSEEYKFDIDDLFYYSSHRIIKRGGYLYVNDYGMQYNILYRYGIHSHSVPDRDYRFVNGDSKDLRYSNIQVLNPYHGVFIRGTSTPVYDVRINVIGEVNVGSYRSETDAAIAYNKAGDLLKKNGVVKNYPVNFISDMNPSEYAKRYSELRLSKSFLEYCSRLQGTD